MYPTERLKLLSTPTLDHLALNTNRLRKKKKSCIYLLETEEKKRLLKICVFIYN